MEDDEVLKRLVDCLEGLPPLPSKCNMNNVMEMTMSLVDSITSYLVTDVNRRGTLIESDVVVMCGESTYMLTISMIDVHGRYLIVDVKGE